MKRLAILLFWSVAAVAQAQQHATEGPQKQSQPSLGDTEKWIRQTFGIDNNTGWANCNEFNRDVPGSEYGMSYRCLYENYVFDLKECNATLKVERSHGTDADERNVRDFKDDTVLAFDLRDIDPSSIQSMEPTFGAFGDLKKKTYHFNDPQAEVDFHTTDDADTMTSSFPNGHSPTEKLHKCCGVTRGIYMTPEYAARFVKAFRHAVELCGGKPSAF